MSKIPAMINNTIDVQTFSLAYRMGYQAPRYPLPAHRYSVLFTNYSVEMISGIKTEWYPSYPEAFRGPHYDVDCVLYVQAEFPEDFYT